MDFLQIIYVGAILAAGVALQGAVGFGLGLFAVPLMIWAGIELPVAIATLLGAVTIQTVAGCWRYREHTPWRATMVMTVYRYLTLPVGVALLTVLAGAGRDRAKQVIGAVLLAVLLVQWLVRVKPRAKLHPAWAAVAGLSSGTMAGAVGMGGPPVVLWAMAHDWPGRQSRAFLWSTFLVAVPGNAALLAWAFGWPALMAIAVGLAYAPLILAATAVGSRLGDRFNRHRLQSIALAFLMAVAVMSVVSPLF